jgi:hypothetical protein
MATTPFSLGEGIQIAIADNVQFIKDILERSFRFALMCPDTLCRRLRTV